MRILCPNCGFDREMDEAKIPPRAQMATCPRCQHKFRFRVVDDLPPEDPADTARREAEYQPPQPGAEQGQPGAPDPMAAQRAAAEAAWRHIQGAKDEPAHAARQDEALSGQSENSGQPGQPGDFGQPPKPDNAQQGYWTSGSDQPYAGSPVPFEDLPGHGFFPGLWGTIRQVLATPGQFFRSMPTTGGMARPLIFHLLLAEFMVVCQYLWSLTGLGAMAQLMHNQELMDMGMGLAGAGPILIFVFYPLLLVLRLMLMTGIIHLILLALFRFTGGTGRGAEATFRVLCYSAAPLVLGLVPFFGPFIGGLWSIALTIIGLKEAHRTRGSAAMFAVLVPILMLLAAVIGLMQSGMKG